MRDAAEVFAPPAGQGAALCCREGDETLKLTTFITQTELLPHTITSAEMLNVSAKYQEVRIAALAQVLHVNVSSVHLLGMALEHVHLPGESVNLSNVSWDGNGVNNNGFFSKRIPNVSGYLTMVVVSLDKVVS